MRRELGADLVTYAVVPVGSSLHSVAHLTYEPGQSFTGSASGFVGGNRTEQVARYAHFVRYLVT